MAFTKTQITPSPIVLQQITCPNLLYSSTYDVSTAFFCNFIFRVAGVTGSFNQYHGTPTLRIQGLQSALGSEGWSDLMRLSLPRDTISARSSANAMIIGQTALGGFGAAPNWPSAPYHVCITDRLTGLNPEFHWATDMVLTNLNIEDGLIHNFANGINVWLAPRPIRRSVGIASMKSLRFFLDTSRSLSSADAFQAAIYNVEVTAILNVGLT